MAATEEAANEVATPRLQFGLTHLFALITLVAAILGFCGWLQLPMSLAVAALLAAMVTVACRWTSLARFSIGLTYLAAGLAIMTFATSVAWGFALMLGTPIASAWLPDGLTILIFGPALGLSIGLAYELILGIFGAADAPLNAGIESNWVPQNRWLRVAILGGLLLPTFLLGAWATLHVGMPAYFNWSKSRAMSGLSQTPLQEMVGREFGMEGTFGLADVVLLKLLEFGVYEEVQFHFEKIPVSSAEEQILVTSASRSGLARKSAVFFSSIIIPGAKHTTFYVCDRPEVIEEWRVWCEPWGGRIGNVIR